MYRRILAPLVFAGPPLIVVFAVVMAASGLAGATGDMAASRVLFWIAMASLMLLATDMILLVLTLGVAALDDRSTSNRENS